MKIRDDDPFFTTGVPVLTIRADTPDEAKRRAERWAQSRADKLARQLKTAGRKARRATRKAAGEEEPPLPWHEIAATWGRLCSSYDGCFVDDNEKEVIRLAFAEGGPCWTVWLHALARRKRDADARAAERPARPRSLLTRL